MEVETVWGKIKTRLVATRMTRTHYVMLKDNPNIKPLIEWLKNLKIKSIEELQFPKLKESIENIKFNHEVKLEFHKDYQALIFSNNLPLQGDFNKAIPEYLNLLHKAMYKPEGIIL